MTLNYTLEQLTPPEHLTVMLSLVITAIPALTANECVESFLALDPPLNLRSYDLYESWYDDNSSVTLAQVGTYKGVDAIKEYVQFAYDSSPPLVGFARSSAL